MLIVAILVIPVIFLGTLLLVFAVTPDTFSDATQVLAALTTVFAVIATLVGFYFGIKTSGDMRDTLETVHRDLVSSLTSTTPPTVASVNPLPESSVVAGTINVVSATFSQDMADGTINKNTFTLARREEAGNFVSVGGEVRYNLASKTATFDPTEKPLPLGSYRATITTGVQNKAGIAMAGDYVWTFQIIEEGGLAAAGGGQGVTDQPLEPVWDESNVSTAFEPGNQRGSSITGQLRQALAQLAPKAEEAAAVGNSNFQLKVPVVRLPGRGLDLAIDLNYNSRLWHYVNPTI